MEIINRINCESTSEHSVQSTNSKNNSKFGEKMEKEEKTNIVYDEERENYELFNVLIANLLYNCFLGI
jgi:hypothetical protein